MGGSAIVAVLALSACGGSSSSKGSGIPKPVGTLNTARVALAIQHSILTERHIRAKVFCPPNIPQQKAFTFTCVATTYSRKGHHPIHTTFTVSQTDSGGHVYYQSPK